MLTALLDSYENWDSCHTVIGYDVSCEDINSIELIEDTVPDCPVNVCILKMCNTQLQEAESFLRRL
jgi:hypothetical protein